VVEDLVLKGFCAGGNSDALATEDGRDEVGPGFARAGGGLHQEWDASRKLASTPRHLHLEVPGIRSRELLRQQPSGPK